MGLIEQVAEELVVELENGNMDVMRAMLADDFTFTDPNLPGEPLSVERWLENNTRLLQAFSDFTFNAKIVQTIENQIWFEAQMQGTHDGAWDLTAYGMGIVPPTGRRAMASKTTAMCTLNIQGQIESIEIVESDENGGLRGMMQQVGISFGI